MLIEQLSEADQEHGHAEGTCHAPLSVTARQSRNAATAEQVGPAMPVAPPTALSSEVVQSWTARLAGDRSPRCAGRGQLRDLLCVSRT